MKLPSYEHARRRVDILNRIITSGFNTHIRTKRDSATDDSHNNSGDGVREASGNVPPVAEGESRRNIVFKIGRENSRPQDSVSGSSVESY